MVARLPHPPPEPGAPTEKGDSALLRSAGLVAGGTLLGYVAVAALLFAGAWAHPFTRVIGDGGDSINFAWFLGWGHFAVTHHLNPLLSNYIDVPWGGANLTWSTNIPLPALLVSPLTGWLGPVFTYNLLVTLGIGTSAWTAFYAVRRYAHRLPAALAGGLLYGFSPTMMAHALGHPHVIVAPLPPLMLIVIDDLLFRHRHSRLLMGTVLGVLAAAQLATGEEVLASSAMVGVIALGLLVAMHRRDWRTVVDAARRITPALLLGVGVCLMLGAFLLWIQFFGPQRPGRVLEPRNEYVSDVFSFLAPTRIQLFAPSWVTTWTQTFHGNLNEWGSYLGAPLTALLAWTAYRNWRSPKVRVVTCLFLVCAVLSLGFTLHIAGRTTLVPAAVVALLAVPLRRSIPAGFLLAVATLGSLAMILMPVIDNILPARLMLQGFLFAAILLALFVDDAIDQRRRRGLSLALLGLAVVALLPVLPYPSTAPAIPTYFTSAVRQLPVGSVALVAPYARASHGEAMLWQAIAGMRFRMPEGYVFVPNPAVNSSDPPASATQTTLAAAEKGQAPLLDDGLRQSLLADLDRWQVAAVIVGPMAHRDQVVGLYTDLLGGPPQWTEGVALWRR
jgi:hypothetical protein